MKKIIVLPVLAYSVLGINSAIANAIDPKAFSEVVPQYQSKINAASFANELKQANNSITPEMVIDACRANTYGSNPCDVCYEFTKAVITKSNELVESSGTSTATQPTPPTAEQPAKTDDAGNELEQQCVKELQVRMEARREGDYDILSKLLTVNYADKPYKSEYDKVNNECIVMWHDPTTFGGVLWHVKVESFIKDVAVKWYKNNRNPDAVWDEYVRTGQITNEFNPNDVNDSILPYATLPAVGTPGRKTYDKWKHMTELKASNIFGHDGRLVKVDCDADDCLFMYIAKFKEKNFGGEFAGYATCYYEYGAYDDELVGINNMEGQKEFVNAYDLSWCKKSKNRTNVQSAETKPNDAEVKPGEGKGFTTKESCERSMSRHTPRGTNWIECKQNPSTQKWDWVYKVQEDGACECSEAFKQGHATSCKYKDISQGKGTDNIMIDFACVAATCEYGYHVSSSSPWGCVQDEDVANTTSASNNAGGATSAKPYHCEWTTGTRPVVDLAKASDAKTELDLECVFSRLPSKTCRTEKMILDVSQEKYDTSNKRAVYYCTKSDVRTSSSIYQSVCCSIKGEDVACTLGKKHVLEFMGEPTPTFDDCN